MPKSTLFLPLFALILFVLACQKESLDRVPKTYNLYQPVYLELDDYRQTSGILQAARPIEQPTITVVYQDYLFMKEYGQGIHVIDNADPANPQAVGFIAMEGVGRLFIRQDYLYVSDYADLVVFDLADPAGPKTALRNKNIFLDEPLKAEQGLTPYYEPAGEQVTLNVGDANYEKDIFWLESEQQYAVEKSLEPQDGWFYSRNGKEAIHISDREEIMKDLRNQARLSIVGDQLYIVQDEILKSYALTEGVSPKFVAVIDEFNSVSSVRAYENYLFLDGRRGLLVVDNQQPEKPRLIKDFRSYNPCNPAYVTGNYGYIGVRSGVYCGSYSSENGVFIHDLSSSEAVLTQILAAESPYDIEVVNGQVLIADGTNGLLIYRAGASAPEGILLQPDQRVQLEAYRLIPIPSTNRVVVIAGEGVYQYDLSNPETPEELSVIPL